MSAIFGLFRFSPCVDPVAEMQRMDRALDLHGADGGGIWCADAVALGSKMARFTPEDIYESQPKISSDGTVLVTDARIDNRRELAGELELPVHELEKKPDSSFVHLSYRRWGLDAPAHLVGVYSFALWDAHQQRLVLVRSPLSDRQIYYHISSDACTFASSPKALFSLSRIQKRIDRRSCAEYLVVYPSDRPATLFEGICQLRGGHCLIVTPNGVEERVFWEPDFQRRIRYPDDRDYYAAFLELFSRVVSDNMRAASPVGIMLSGGLDSSTVAVIAANHLPVGGTLAAFTEVPQPDCDMTVLGKGFYGDETPFVRELASVYPAIIPHFVRTDGRFFLEDPVPLFEEAGWPFYAAPHKVWYDAIHAQARSNGVRVLLSGASGNMTMSWNGRGRLQQLVRSRNWAEAWQESGRPGASIVDRLRTFIRQGVLPFMPEPLVAVMHAIRHPERIPALFAAPWYHYSPINPQFARDERVSEWHDETLHGALNGTEEHSARCRFRYFQLSEMTLPVQVGYKALYGVESRDPTRDLRLFEYCLSLPERVFYREGEGRLLVRNSMLGLLPEPIRTNRRRGRQSADWYQRLLANRRMVFNELDAWKESSLPVAILDKRRLCSIARKIGEPDAPLRHGEFLVLQKGLMTGRFLRWVEDGV